MRNTCCVSKVRFSLCTASVLALGLGSACHSSLRVGRTHVDASADGKRDADLADGLVDIPGNGGNDAAPDGGTDARDDGRSDSALTDGSDLRDVGKTSVLNLVAGVSGGPGDLDGIGATARFRSPSGVTSDGVGNLFVTDSGNSVVRRIDIATGTVTTLAGSPRSTGRTDGTGTAARFESPRGVASDGLGNLFVVDWWNSSIRKVVVATSEVTTLAGGTYGNADGTGAAAQFALPDGVASDGAGSLFVADGANHAIRKVDVATGVVTTLAGSQLRYSGSTDGTGAAAQFNDPAGVAFAGTGDLFVADSGNHTIRKVDVATGAVTTVAGSPGTSGSTDGTGTAARFYAPIGIASDGAGNLFVVDSGNNVIRRVVIATWAVTTLAGSPSLCGTTDGTRDAARFCSPLYAAIDGAGNLFVTDTYGPTIRKVNIASGNVSTLAGSPTADGSADGPGSSARFSSPKNMASDGSGNLFVADSGNHTIRRVDLASGAVTTLAGSSGVRGSTDGTGTAARFNTPSGLVIDKEGNLFVSDHQSNIIRKVVVATGAVTTLAGSSLGSTDGIGSAAQFTWPDGMAIDDSGNLFVGDMMDATIRKVDIATATVTTLVGLAGHPGSSDGTGSAARFGSSEKGLACDGAGNLFVADSSNSTIRKIVIATGVVTTFAGIAGKSGNTDGTGSAALFGAPVALVNDGAGNLFVTDRGNHTIRKLVIATQEVTTVVGTPESVGVILGPLPASLSCPWGLALGPSGELLISDECEHSILAAWF
jgi:sugar lactone lactonase YvrE